MLESQQLNAASELLFDSWRAGRHLAHLPEHLKPTTRQEGYGIQQCLHQRTPAALFGWKIAATSVAGQKHIAVDGPMAGRLFADRVIPDGGTHHLGANRMLVAEMEFAFRLGRAVQPRSARYTVPDVLDAVESLHPAIEIPDSRFLAFERVGEASLIADNACAHDFVLGPRAPESWRGVDLAAHPVRGRITSASGVREGAGSGANVLGDPRIALAWLVNELSGLGITLNPGEVITTGTCVTPMAIAAGDNVLADFGPLGQVGVSIAP